MGDGFGCKRFTSALNSDQEQPSRVGQTILTRSIGKGTPTAQQPVFEVIQTTDIGNLFFGGIEIENLSLADGLAFFSEYQFDIIGANLCGQKRSAGGSTGRPR